MTNDLLARLEELARKATPGPWTHVEDDGRKNQGIIFSEEIIPEYHPTKPIATIRGTAWKDRGRDVKANASYIAACSPDRILALTAVARHAQIVADAWEWEPGTAPPIDRLLEALASLQALQVKP